MNTFLALAVVTMIAAFACMAASAALYHLSRSRYEGKYELAFVQSQALGHISSTLFIAAFACSIGSLMSV